MAFFNNLATFRIVNNQIFIFVYKTFPLVTNSPLSKDSNTEMKVIFPSERHNLVSNSTDFTVRAQNDTKNRVRDQFDKTFFSAFFMEEYDLSS